MIGVMPSPLRKLRLRSSRRMLLLFSCLLLHDGIINGFVAYAPVQLPAKSTAARIFYQGMKEQSTTTATAQQQRMMQHRVLLQQKAIVQRRQTNGQQQHRCRHPELILCFAKTTATTTEDHDAAVVVAGNKDKDKNTATTNHNNSTEQRALGVAVLLTVPLAWGTYTPVVKYLYAIQPPVPGLVFSAAYYVVAAVSLWLVIFFVTSTTSTTSRTASSSSTNTAATRPEENDVYVFATVSLTDDSNTTIIPTIRRNATTAAITSTSTPDAVGMDDDPGMPWRGGAELGSYLFCANVLQVVGLQTVPADRAGFLVQLTTVIVPLMEAFVFTSSSNNNDTVKKSSVPAKTWVACLLAFCGVIVIDLDGKTAADLVMPSEIGSSSSNPFSLVTESIHVMSGVLTTGDCLILMAAVVYSLHVVRLERYAKESSALKLAASKATVEAVLSTGLVLGLMAAAAASSSFDGDSSSSDMAGLVAFASGAGRDMLAFFATMASTISGSSSNDVGIPASILVPAVGAVLWTGWVTCAYTIYAQSFGQSRVKPTDANLIYSVQPLFTALFAFVLLGETMGPAGIAGGSLIATAVYMVAMADTNTTNNSSGNDNDSAEDMNNGSYATKDGSDIAVEAKFVERVRN